MWGEAAQPGFAEVTRPIQSPTLLEHWAWRACGAGAGGFPEGCEEGRAWTGSLIIVWERQGLEGFMLAARERRRTGAVDALTLPPWRWPSLALALALEAKTSSSLCPSLSSLGLYLSFSSNISLST